MEEKSGSEAIIYEEGDIRITTSRAMIGSKTFAMSNITSVSKGKEEEDVGCVVLAFIVGGVGAVIYGIAGPEWVIVISGAVFVVLGFWIANNGKTKYSVKIGSASGETNALESEDESWIDKIVDAMNEAIVQRG